LSFYDNRFFPVTAFGDLVESDSASIEVAFTTLYADVKEPAGPRTLGPTDIWIFLSFYARSYSKRKSVDLLCFTLPISDFGFRIADFLRSTNLQSAIPNSPSSLVGVTGFEPVTLRLSSACSNQLSYTPGALK
jgi:hypothetical protein